MHPALELLILPGTPADRAARALAHVPFAASSVVALAVPVPRANALAVRLLTEDGRPAPVDLAVVAAALSTQDHGVGLARLDGDAERRAWLQYRGGQQIARFTVDDELWIPLDERGQPDLDGDMRRFGDGVPEEGWRRLRSCLDLGMERFVSCRFTPITRALERLRAGEDSDARAWILVSGGRALLPPQEIGWRQLFR
ncbi:MAG: hypothetical protein H6739_12820 [Alphaproteobacteria bacterium]|nr:hypothetical protein [Alphaproteobacteria bacterium]